MKLKTLLIVTIIFFLIVNTAYYWEAKIETYAFPALTVLASVYLTLIIILGRKIYFYLKVNPRDKKGLLLISSTAILLILIAYKPFRLINFEKFEGKDLLFAEREGAANCLTVFKLKENNKFTERSVCFGISEINGDFELKNDTIFFKNINYGRGSKEYYKFALIKPAESQNKKIIGTLVRYSDHNDTLGHELWIIKNEIKN